MSRTDVRLIEACLDGDPSAFGQLLDRHEKTVYNLVLRMVRHPQDAQDITQEIFLNCYRHLGRFDTKKSFSTWLLSIARNQTLYRLRSARNRKETATEDLSDIPREGPGSQEIAEKNELRDSVLRCLDSLPERYREVLVLRHLLDRTYQEISEILSMKLGTVKTNIHMGRKLIHQKLVEEGLI